MTLFLTYLPQPQDKPLRTKRGHRKPSLLGPGEAANGPGATFINQNLTTLSPSSDAFSHSHLETTRDSHAGRGTNGIPKPPKRPSNAFEIYCNDTRPVLQAQHKEKIAAGEFFVEEELARGWKDLPEEERKDFQARYEEELAKWKDARDAYKRETKQAAARERSRNKDNTHGRGHRVRHGDATHVVEAAEDYGDDDNGDDDNGDEEDEEMMWTKAQMERRFRPANLVRPPRVDSDPETEVEEEEQDVND